MLESVEKDDSVLSSAEKSSPAFPNALSSGLLKKKESGSVPVGGNPSSMPAMATVEAGGGAFVGTAIKILGALVVVGGLGVGGWWLYSTFTSGEPEATTLVDENSTAPEASQATASDTSLEVAPVPTYQIPAVSQSATVTARTNNDAILFGELTDTDKDGLSDMREQELGTGVNSFDSDGDTLSDSDEVLVWKTNPLSSDTDGDSYPDGTEIKNGYNPLGPGRLVLPGTATSTQ
jgi:hypothetical protein